MDFVCNFLILYLFIYIFFNFTVFLKHKRIKKQTIARTAKQVNIKFMPTYGTMWFDVSRFTKRQRPHNKSLNVSTSIASKKNVKHKTAAKEAKQNSSDSGSNSSSGTKTSIINQ